jgi:hypothetical protein
MKETRRLGNLRELLLLEILLSPASQSPTAHNEEETFRSADENSIILRAVLYYIYVEAPLTI